MHIPSPQPKMKDAELAPVKKKSITVDEYRAREQCRRAEPECEEAERKQQEEETLCRCEEMRQLDQEDRERMARIKESREQEEKARWDTEAELVRHMLEAEVARAAESPPQDKNNKKLDYYDDVDWDTEIASSQETVEMTSQESNNTTPTSSQGTVPMSSQKSMSQEASMPSLEPAGGTTILDAAGRIPMEDEACLDGPTMRCTPDEERTLLNPLLTGSFDHLKHVSLGCLNVLVARINEIRKVKASQTPVPLPRAPPGLTLPASNLNANGAQCHSVAQRSHLFNYQQPRNLSFLP